MGERYKKFDDRGLYQPEYSEESLRELAANPPPDEDLRPSVEYGYLEPGRTPDILGPDLTTDKLFVKDTGNEHVGRGLYARKAIQDGEHVFEFDGLRRGEKVAALSSQDGFSAHSIAVGVDRKNPSYFVYATPNKLSPLRYLNHSCNPNVGRVADDMFGFVALRPIAEGEELTVDYSLLEVNPYWELSECGCGSPDCRGKIGSASSLPMAYLQENWQRLTPEMQVTAIQFSKDPEITKFRNEAGADFMFSGGHPFSKKYSREDIAASAHPTIVRERNYLGAKELASKFMTEAETAHASNPEKQAA